MTDVQGERALWAAVVILAVQDATEGPKAGTAYGKQAALLKHQAQAWLRNAGRDYRLVCALAGADADALRDEFLSGRLAAVARENGMRPQVCHVGRRGVQG